MRQRWVFLLAALAMCALTAAVPSVSPPIVAPIVVPVAAPVAAPTAPVSRQTPLDQPDGHLVEDTFYVTEGIEVNRRLLAAAKGVAFRSADLAVGVKVDQSGRLYGTPERSGTYVAPVQVCSAQTCQEQQVTLVVLGNVPWEPRELTFPGKVGAPLDGEIGVNGGPSGVVPTFTVTDHAKLPEGVTIGPDGHVGGVPAAAGISEVPVRICVAGNCAGVVVRLIIV